MTTKDALRRAGDALLMEQDRVLEARKRCDNADCGDCWPATALRRERDRWETDVSPAWILVPLLVVALLVLWQVLR